MKIMMVMQRPNGHIEDGNGEGNYNRTVLLGVMVARVSGRDSGCLV